MFSSILFIVIPVLFVFVGTIAALSFAREPQTLEAQAVKAEAKSVAAEALAQSPSILFRPIKRPEAFDPDSIDELPVAELLALIESHLKEESRAAKAFSKNPSAYTLWLN